MPTTSELRTMKEAAAYLGVSRSRIYFLCRTGELNAVKIGAMTFVTRSSLARIAEQQRRLGRKPPLRRWLGYLRQAFGRHQKKETDHAS